MAVACEVRSARVFSTSVRCPFTPSERVREAAKPTETAKERSAGLVADAVTIETQTVWAPGEEVLKEWDWEEALRAAS